MTPPLQATVVVDPAHMLDSLLNLPDAALGRLAARMADVGPPAAEETQPFVDAREAARLLAYPPGTKGVRRIYGLVSERRLTRYGPGRRLLLSRSEVLALAAGHSPGGDLLLTPGGNSPRERGL